MSHHLHDKKITRCVRILPSTCNVRIVTGASSRVEHVYNKTLDTCAEPRLARDGEEEERGREKSVGSEQHAQPIHEKRMNESVNSTFVSPLLQRNHVHHVKSYVKTVHGCKKWSMAKKPLGLECFVVSFFKSLTFNARSITGIWLHGAVVLSHISTVAQLCGLEDLHRVVPLVPVST